MTKHTIVHIKLVSPGYPHTLHGTLDDGQFIRLYYRWGGLTIHVATSEEVFYETGFFDDSNMVYDLDVDDAAQDIGWLTHDELLAATKHLITYPQDFNLNDGTKEWGKPQ